VGLPKPGDCNGNGIPDVTEIADGHVADLNQNGIPDECEIGDGQLIDRDRNGTADLYEPAPANDLNRNGLADFNEIFIGLLTDENGNTIPDEFELFPRTLQFEAGKSAQFYRARAGRIIIRTISPDQMDVDVQGGNLEKSDQVTGPFIEVPNP
jgi:hypothetical protein